MDMQNLTNQLYRQVISQTEKSLIEDILKTTDGNQLKAARILGINRNTLRAKIRKLSIDMEHFKNGVHIST